MASSPSRVRTSSIPATGRRERHRTQTRDRLYRAALQLFAERGFLRTTVEDITEAADVGKGTFFNYFPTKEHILAEFGGERTAALQRALEEARTTKGPVMDVMKNLAASAAGQADENPALLRAIYAAHASCESVRVELQKRALVTRKYLAEILALAQSRGELRRDVEPGELARLIQVFFMGVTMGWSINPSSTLRKASEDAWALVWPGLQSSKTPLNGSRRRGAKS